MLKPWKINSLNLNFIKSPGWNYKEKSDLIKIAYNTNSVYLNGNNNIKMLILSYYIYYVINQRNHIFNTFLFLRRIPIRYSLS